MIKEKLVHSLMDYRRTFSRSCYCAAFPYERQMKPLVMFWNVTCVVRCCMTLDDTDSGGGPVQPQPQVGRKRMMTRRGVFDVFTWRFLRNEKKMGEECDTSSTACGIEHTETDVKNPTSFFSPWKLYKAAKKQDSSINLKQVEHFLESQKSYTLHRHFNLRFCRRKVLACGVRYQFQADLIDYALLKRENGGMTFLLSVIDVFSQYAMLVPIKDKRGDTVRDALVKVFDHMGTPLKLQMDKGKEFYNHYIRQLLNEKMVHHFSTEQDVKAQIVERFNRTMREVIKCYMTHMTRLRYVDILPDFLARYNDHPHSSIYPYSPASLMKENEHVVHKLQYGDYLRERRLYHKYNIEDRVRITQYQGTFHKSYRNKNFTEEVFTIVDKLFTKPPMYRLKDMEGEMIEGSFYERELQHVCDG